MKKIKSPLKAIRAHCKKCVGTYAEIIDCGGENSCELYDFRFGKNPFRKKVILTQDQKDTMIENLNKAREAVKEGRDD